MVFNSINTLSESFLDDDKAGSFELDERRLLNYLKLSREQALNSASLAQRRASDKGLSKYYKRTQGEAKKLKGR